MPVTENKSNASMAAPTPTVDRLPRCAILMKECPDSLRVQGPDRYSEARAFVIGARTASCSAIQRALLMGFNEAAGYVERMEEAGIVSRPGKDGVREVLTSALSRGGSEG